MDKEKLYDITEVCRMTGTTSRALRFYEEKGIVKSTSQGLSHRRKYTEAQLEQIKNVLALRSLGLSVKSIDLLQKNKSDLREIVSSKRAEIYAVIDSKIREINLLNDVLFSLASGSVPLPEVNSKPYEADDEETEILIKCTNAIVTGETEFLYQYLSERLRQYLPKSAFEKIRNDTFEPLGSYISVEKSEKDEKYPHRFYQFVRFSKLGLKITYVIYQNKIEGLWLGYYESKERGQL